MESKSEFNRKNYNNAAQQWFQHQLQRNLNQRYTGQYLYNNLHSKGIYIIDKKKDQTYYDGLFYCNKLEGYGTVVNADGTVFEGLFKNQKRFGPGVVTYNDSSQDVGFWDGFVLRRLTTIINENSVFSFSAKSNIFKFREMVPIFQQKYKEDLEPILNSEVRNEESLFFKQDLYNNKFYQHFEDRMESILLQLKQTNLKLNKLTEKIKSITLQLETCKKCCLRNTNVKRQEIQKKLYPSYSSSTQSDDVNHSLTKSEIELQNYLYTNSFMVPEDYDEKIHLSVSAETIPFSKTSSTNIEKPSKGNVLNSEDYYKNSDHIFRCGCTAQLIDNIDNLETLLQELNNEKQFYDTIKITLTRQMDALSLATAKFEPKISYLIAWNNEKLFKEMLQHCFKNQFCDDLVSFDISSLVNGQRDDFNEIGLYEEKCLQFLQSCVKGSDVIKCFKKLKINPDLCDANGNTGMMLASVNDKHLTIEKLINLGANIDFMNDACLTPLTCSFLRYLSQKYDILDWNRFLKYETFFQNDFQNFWPPVLLDIFEQEPHEYFFDLSYNRPVSIALSANSLDPIKKTILTLLKRGADPNNGIVPLKAIFLAIFTDDSELMLNLLQNHANSNACMENNLTSLHVIVILNVTNERLKMFQMLLTFGADPNEKTTHWDETKNMVHNAPEKFEDNAKNLLHLLALRQDYENEDIHILAALAKILVYNECKTDELYYGHSPLSLAVLQNKIYLIESLLQSNRVDPHLLLENNMGNALTVLFLEQYSSYWKLETKKQLAETLIENGLNPLRAIYTFHNVIEFIQRFQNNTESSNSVEFKSKTQIAKKSKSKISKKSEARNSKMFRSIESLDDYIILKTRNILMRHLYAKAIVSLYKLVRETLLADPLVIILAQFVVLNDIVKVINILVRHNIINGHEFSTYILYELIHFVKIQQNLYDTHSEQQLKKEIKNFTWKALNLDLGFTSIPEIDSNDENYKVCFHCLLGSDKVLICCPNCELIYFCSQSCNESNNKISNEHKCNILFYNEMLELVGGKMQPSRLKTLLSLAEKMKNEKDVFNDLQKLEDKMTRLELLSNKTKKQFEQLLEKYHDVCEEKEKFAIANNLWDERLLFITNNSIKKEKTKIRFYDLSILALNGSSTKLKSITSSQLYFDNLIRRKSGSNFSESPHPNSEESPKRKKTSTDISFKQLQLFSKLSKSKTMYSTQKLLQNMLIEKTRDSDKTKRKVDKKYYIQLLSKVFADFNLPLLLLPYACYKDGQVYYSMTGQKTYSDGGFHKLKIGN